MDSEPEGTPDATPDGLPGGTPSRVLDTARAGARHTTARSATDRSATDRSATDRSATDRDGSTDVWMRWIVGWHLTFWAVVGLGLLSLGLAENLDRGQRLFGVGLFAALGTAYAGLLQRTGRTTGWRYRVYLVVAVLVTGAACALRPELSLVLFIVYPQVWMFAEGIREAIGFTIAVSGAAFTGFVVYQGPGVAAFRENGPSMLVSMLFSILLGLWLSRIIDQSRERAALLAQIAQTRTELAEAHHAQGVMAERERLAREIHDTLAQGFTGIVMHAQAATGSLHADPPRSRDTARHLGTIEEMARENLAEARALVAAFTPVGLDGSTLADAVRRLAERFGQQTGVPVEAVVDGTGAGLTRAQEVVVLRAVQEALANVRRHARAGRVTVRLSVDGAGARVEVGDDGVGFAPQEVTSGYGLSGMRSRVGEVGGELEITSSPGGGTWLQVRIPAPAPAGDGTPAPQRGREIVREETGQ
ncbi:MAG: sensor histidine kinase [Kineosporiaceae bacterium]